MTVRAKVSSKGQIVIPKRIRDELRIVDGTEIEFVQQGRGFFARPVENFDPRFPRVPAGTFMKHVVRVDRPFPTDEEIDRAMLAEAARRFDAAGR